MKRKYLLSTSIATALGLGAVLASAAFADESLQDVMKRRSLSEKDVLAAAKTYVPPGGRDEFIVFSSTGQAGQVLVYGIPSMRPLKYIGVFTPEPFQGYSYDDESKKITVAKTPEGDPVTWGDTHHPDLSKTDGDYDGQYLFINDKNTPRIAVIGLKDFETRQIVVNPVLTNEHGGAFVTNNTEYVMEASQLPAPLGHQYAPLSEFNDKYRGGLTMWKFNREKGMIEPENSFAIELPPYSQDLTATGKGPSEGWVFVNSFCSDRYIGGVESGRAPFEAGCSAKDTDFLHVINWKKAEEVFKAGKVEKINGMAVISLQTSIDEGIVYLVPEAKSPHGNDVSPDGKYDIVGGKLDTHDSVYDTEKILSMINAKEFVGEDAYGLPILDMKKALHTQVELGLGPLHTQFDAKPCIAYTSLYVDSMVAKWDYCEGKVLDKISVHYNIGHLLTPESATLHPKGHYLVAMNKLSIDRFDPVGPLHPMSHQLIDVSGDKMQLLYDAPIPLGEPHQGVAIDIHKLKPEVRYKYGTNSDNKESAFAVRPGSEKIVSDPGKVEVFGTVIRSHFTPEIVQAQEGDDVTFHWTNAERAENEVHGFGLSQHSVNLSLEPGKTASATFHNVKAGVYPYYCTEFCSALHLEMEGYLVVAPKGAGPTAQNAAVSVGAVRTKGDFDKQYKQDLDTQAVIDQVVGYITSVNYKDFPTVVNLVQDATDQLTFAKDARAKADDFAKKEDWQNAALWANQWWQYQVKAADIGLRAKT
jgi:nitrous-oxide reductase